MNIRKQLKEIGFEKIEKVLKNGGFLKGNGFTLTFNETTHDIGIVHHTTPKGMFMVSSWAVLSKSDNILEALANFSRKIENRTKVTLMKKQPEFVQV